ncbi:MAG: ParB/RepB/Spo0J family partition protein [Phycisphaerales bacterium]|nr:MAG: ParB/RepB/Spo0J family partition protein [Phycisphaerales bacterium]
MSKPTKRLGRGLDSLVSNLTVPEPTPDHQTPSGLTVVPAKVTAAEGESVKATMAAIDALAPNPHQPRHGLDETSIATLAESIRRSGLLHPIAVRPSGGRYQIIAGERRWAAAKALQMTHVPVIVREASDEQMLELALVENIQREDLNAIDRAAAYRDFCARFNLSPEDVAQRLGEDRTTVVNYLRLLDLPGAIKDLVAGDALSMGHARCLLGITNDDRRMQLAESVVRNELSVRALEEIVRRERAPHAPASPNQDNQQDNARSAHVAELQRRFEDAVGTKVLIREGRRKATGRIIIEYYSLDDFDRLASLLGVADE